MQTLKELFREKVSRTVATECSDEELFRSSEMMKYLNGMVHRLTNRQHSLSLLPPGSNITAYTNGKEITVNPFNELVSALPLQSQRALATAGFVCHECAHIRYLDFKESVQIINRIKDGELGPFPVNLPSKEQQYLRELQQMADETPLTFQLMSYLYSQFSNIIEDVHDEGCLIRDFKGIVPASLKILQDSMQGEIKPFEQMAEYDEDGERDDMSLFFSSVLQIARFGEIVTINDEQAAKDPIYQAALRMLPIAQEASKIDSVSDRWPYVNHCILQVWPFVRDSLINAALMQELMKNMPQQGQNGSGQQSSSGSQSQSGQQSMSESGYSSGSKNGGQNSANGQQQPGNGNKADSGNQPSGVGPSALGADYQSQQSNNSNNNGNRQQGDVGQNCEADGQGNTAGNTAGGGADNSEAGQQNGARDNINNTDAGGKDANGSDPEGKSETAQNGGSNQGSSQSSNDDASQNDAGKGSQDENSAENPEQTDEDGEGNDSETNSDDANGQDTDSSNQKVKEVNSDDTEEATNDGNSDKDNQQTDESGQPSDSQGNDPEDDEEGESRRDHDESDDADTSENSHQDNSGRPSKSDFSKLTSQDIQSLIGKLKEAAKNAGVEQANSDQGLPNEDESDQIGSSYNESITSHGRMNSPDKAESESDDEVSAEAVFSEMSAQIAKQAAEDGMKQAVETALNNEYTNDLNLASQTSPHRGRPIFVHRTHEPTASDISKYERVLKVVKPYSIQAQRRIVPLLEELRSGSVERHRPFGRTVESKDGYRPDGKFFSKIKLPQDLPDMAIAILVDQSGSMHGARLDQAQKAAVLLDDFATSIGIPTLVVGHNTHNASKDRVEGTALYLHALFERVSNKDKARLAMMKADGSNRDGMALNAVSEILAKRPEEYKILIIISDGLPNSQDYGGELAEQDIRNIVAAAKRKGVQTFAAAIGSSKENIRRIYGEGFLDITDLSTLPRNLLKIISKRII